jgi:signal transduction histidine kinase
MKREASLGRRLLLAASAFIAVALVIAAVVIGFVLHRFIQGQIDQRLDTQVTFLASMLHADRDGTITLAGSADGPPFDRPARGWYWQVSGPRNVLRARSLAGATLDLSGVSFPTLPPPPRRESVGPPPPRPADGPGPYAEPLHFRIKHIVLDDTPAEIVVSAPRAAVIDPLREAMVTLGLSLLVLGAALLIAIVLQVRLGLRPLERLRQAVAEVRAGRRERVPADQPIEIQPLVAELNGLLAQNAETLDRARGHVANLAHGLKTPLATLSVALSGKGSNDELIDLVDVMERRIRHHLGRARAAALGGPVRAQTPIGPPLEALGAVLGKIHVERRLVLTLNIPTGLAVACERQDFDEIAGNVLENAFKWARSSVLVQARPDDRMVILTIEDDGPGLTPEQIPQVLQPGQRLDENAPGFGFGLSITRELVELYGGTLVLAPASEAGLRVTLRLPLG